MIQLFSLFIFMALSFFFSGFETGFVSLDKYFVLFLCEIKKEKKFKKIKTLLDKKELVLTVLLICNNITIVASTFSFNFLTYNILSSTQIHASNHVFIQVILSVVILTPILFFFCEVLPKSLFKTYPYTLTRRGLNFFLFFYYLTYPAAMIFNALSKTLLMVFKRGNKMASINEDTTYFKGTLSLVNKELSSSIEEDSIEKIISQSKFSIRDFAQKINSHLVFNDTDHVKDVKDRISSKNSIVDNNLYIFVKKSDEIKGCIKIDSLQKTGETTHLRNIMSSMKKIDPEKISIHKLFATLDKKIIYFEKSEKYYYIDSRVLLKKIFF